MMPNASNTERVRAAIGGDDVTEERAVIAVQGPRGAAPAGGGGAGGRGGRPVPRRARSRGDGVGLHRRRHRLHRRGRRRDLGARPEAAVDLWRADPRRRRGPGRPGRPRHPPAGGRPARCTATSWDRASPRCRPGWVGSSRGRSRRSGARTHSRPSGSGACTGCFGASPPKGGDRRGRSARCGSTAPRWGRPPAATSRPSSATASRWPSCRPRGGGHDRRDRPPGLGARRRRGADARSSARPDDGGYRLPTGWSGWRRASPSCTAATGSPGSPRTWPARSAPATGWSSCRTPARCCTCRPPTTRWPIAAVTAAHEAFLELAGVPGRRRSRAFFERFARRLEDDDRVRAASPTPTPRMSRPPGSRVAAPPAWCSRTGCGPTWWRACGLGATRPPGRDALSRVGPTTRAGGWSSAAPRSASSASCSRADRTCSPTPRASSRRQHRRVPHRLATRSAPPCAIHEHALRASAGRGRAPGRRRLRSWPLRRGRRATRCSPTRCLALAVARGSGPAVEQLGAVARQAGLPVSLHGTGGAWLVGGLGPTPTRFAAAVRTPLDRKVCNTLNVCCIVKDRAEELVPAFFAAAAAAGERRAAPTKLHVVVGSELRGPGDGSTGRSRAARRGHGARAAGRTLPVRPSSATEWEWEASPEVTLVVVDGLDDAIALFNQYSPRLVASLLSEDPAEQESFWAAHRRPLRRRRLHPLGRRTVRVRPSRARPVQLAARAAVRP